MNRSINSAFEEFSRVLQTDSANLDQCFCELWKITARVLRRYLLNCGVSEDCIEDSIQEAACRIWQRLPEVSFETVAHWLRYCKVVTDRVRQAQSQNATISELCGEVIPPESLRTTGNFEASILDLIELSGLVEASDKLWLGVEPSMFSTRLLLADYIFVDGNSAEDIYSLSKRILGPAGPQSASELLNWIQDPRILRTIAIIELLSAEKKGALESRAGTNLPRIGDMNSSPQRSVEASPTPESIEEAKTGAITEAMERLWKATRHCTSRSEAFSTSGLWKRLAFHLVPAGMPHLQFVKLFAPAAQICEFELNAIKVHAWVSNRRIFAELAKFADVPDLGRRRTS